MIKNCLAIFVCLCSMLYAQNSEQFPELKGEYLGQKTPGNIPEVFAPGIVSSSNWAEHCQVAVSPKGDEIFWSAWTEEYTTKDFPKGSEQLFYSKLVDGLWTKPKLAEFTQQRLDGLNGGPVFSADGEKLYFYSTASEGSLGAMDTWYVQKIDRKWSQPINVGTPFNSDGIDWTPVFSVKGNAYTNYAKLMKFKFGKDGFSNPEEMIIHKDFRPVFPIYIAPDEQYVIFSAENEKGFGSLDLYISFKDKDNNWGIPINMGPEINTDKVERFPVVSPDGKYLFFMRHTEPDQDFFWVSTEIIEKLKENVTNK
ncbi:MAG: PD40 domain-containing protein [Acidobacteria bacterium]|nr:PD40 domain-containing protein [Acidobacteriota bacterium]